MSFKEDLIKRLKGSFPEGANPKFELQQLLKIIEEVDRLNCNVCEGVDVPDCVIDGVCPYDVHRERLRDALQEAALNDLENWRNPDF